MGRAKRGHLSFDSDDRRDFKSHTRTKSEGEATNQTSTHIHIHTKRELETENFKRILMTHC